MKPKQRKQAIANELVWLAAGVDHRLRCCLQETIDQEYDIEWQARLGQPGRAAHVDEHADDIALFTDVDALPIADKIGSDIGRQQRNHGYIRMRSELTCKPDRWVGAGANAGKHECLAAGRRRQRAAIAHDTNTAGRAARPASADARVRHIEPEAGFENAQTPGHAHPPVGVRHHDRSAPALEHRASAARCKYQHNRRHIEDRKVKKRDFVNHRALRERGRVDVLGAPLRLRRQLQNLVGAVMRASHSEGRKQHGDR